ncbi:MAG: Response regulator receiver [Acidimicrobiales bacterium]|nr:Response regulator receiver [Acidimicrobiales bacterium]
MIDERTFPNEMTSVPAARLFVAAQLDHVDPDVVQDVLLMVSELASNSVRHAGTRFTVAVETGTRGIRVEVADEGAGVAALRTPGLLEPSGRGLLIVDKLSDDWGVQPMKPGKRVWFTVADRP